MIYDLAVIGCGGIGSAVLYHAAAQGAQAIGIEQYSPAHNRGSSHGHTRIIRQAYFEHPNYVPLLLEAYELWAELQRIDGEQLYVETGLLQAGPVDGIVVPGVLRSAAEHNLPIDKLTADEAMQRFPMFRIPTEHVAAYEHRAGYLFVERCVEAHLKAAQDLGARLISDCAVTGYQPEGSGYRIATQHGDVLAQRIVITVGAWLPGWLSGEFMRLQVLRKHLHWFNSSDQRVRQSQGCPLFFFENAIGCFYGFPAIDARSSSHRRQAVDNSSHRRQAVGHRSHRYQAVGLKVAEHSGGEPISDPNQLDRSIDSNDEARINAFVASYFHGQHTPQRHDVCMYTMTSDHHFLIDQHPEHPGVTIAGGFSGHGFKFASVLGKRISHSQLQGTPDNSLAFLARRRD